MAETKISTFALVIFLLAPKSDAQNILGLVVQSADTDPNGMHDPSYVDMDIVNQDFDTCSVLRLTDFTETEGKVFQVR